MIAIPNTGSDDYPSSNSADRTVPEMAFPAAFPALNTPQCRRVRSLPVRSDMRRDGARLQACSGVPPSSAARRPFIAPSVRRPP
ncbi:hypothetical protein JMF97_26245 [Micromonospora fiedleri]|uniref:Uncharacterized protein n=1 Tax=Micromonospora fiedleri TaxID=1157498 RepID=A0ABS1UTG3_9ACTN|nr:hypothetical protein [Micromonospora fiedleri]MBL6279661.1 hypothetical protein [Micromonospora fiedleri]